MPVQNTLKSFRLTREDYAFITSLAKKQDTSVSEIIRVAIKELKSKKDTQN